MEASGDRPRQAGNFVSLDRRLRAAAAEEGFQVLPYAEEVNAAGLAWEEPYR
jgi:hypothetical protein